MSKVVEVTWCTGFNGVSLTLESVAGLTEARQRHYESMFEIAGEDLAELTHEIVGAETFEAINEGDEDPDVVEEMVSDEDENRILTKASENLKRLSDEVFAFKLIYNSTDS